MRFRAALSLCVVIGARLALGDTVTMNNGDKITGTIEELNPTTVIVQTPYAGKLTIERAAIKSMQSEKPVSIVSASGEKQQLFLSPDEKTGWKETAAFVPPPPPPPATPPRHTSFLEISPDWKNQISIGAVNTTGNDETTSFAGSILFHYDKKPNELTLKFEGNYGLSNGSQTAGLFAENAVFRHSYNDKFYGYLDDDIRYDAIKGISLQATATGGLGYWIYKSDKFKFDVRGGPGITYLKTFDGNEDTSPAVEAATRAEYVFNDHVSATNENAYTTSLTDSSIWRIHSETALLLKLDLERGLGLKFAFADDYENQPSAGRNHNDTRLTLSLTLDF